MKPVPDLARRMLLELSVIIVGVLIALAVDRWIASLDARSQESAYLARIEEDLRRDSVTIEAMIRTSVENADLTEAMLGWVEGQALPGDVDAASFMSSFDQASWHTPLNERLVRDTWEELVSSGRIGLIRDPDLRRRISAYYGLHQGLRGSDEDWDETMALYDQAIIPSRSPSRRIAAIRHAGDLPWKRLPLGGRDLPPPDSDDLRETIRFFRAEPTAASWLGSVHVVWIAAETVYGLLLDELNATLQAVTAARP